MKHGSCITLKNGQKIFCGSFVIVHNIAGQPLFYNHNDDQWSSNPLTASHFGSRDVAKHCYRDNLPIQIVPIRPSIVKEVWNHVALHN